MRQFRDRYRYSIILLKQLVKTDFKLRYQSSVLGYLWSLLRPLFLFLILYFVFTAFIPVGRRIPNFPVYLLLGIVMWNYFSEVTNGSVGAIVGKGDLLRKINFPRYVIILAISCSALINLFLNFAVIALFMLLGRVSIDWQALLMVPLMIELFIFAIGISFLLSALFVRFRDISYIWEVMMQAGFYGTPILYALNDIPPKLQKILLLNPMAQIIQDARHVLVTPYSLTIKQAYGNYWTWAIPIAFAIAVTVLSSLYFKNRSKFFAEDV